MKRTLFTVLLLFLTLIVISVATGTNASDNEVIKTYTDLNAFKINSSSKDSSVYLITDTVDLRGKTCRLPLKSKLIFNGGIIINGILDGDSTSMECLTFPIFDRLIITGSWKIREISTDMFKKVDENTLGNMSALSSDKTDNIIAINSDCHVPVKKWDSRFKIKSKSTLILNADIYTMPTKNNGGYCIKVEGDSIAIKGNGHGLYGTILDDRQKTISEWLHGLYIDEKCNGVYVENLNSWYFCGDGFYTRGSNVTFNGINAKFNGRQGLSITKGENIKVENSTFSFTSFYKIASGGGPGAGIDIEPNKGDTINNIIVNGCELENNLRYIKNHVNDLEIYGTGNANIKISNCRVRGLYLGSCSNVTIEHCKELNSIFCIDNKIRNINIGSSGNPAVFGKGLIDSAIKIVR